MTKEVDCPLCNGNDSLPSPSLDTGDPSFISSLPEPLCGYALRAFPTVPDDVNNGTCDNGAATAALASDVTARLDQLEISTRSHLLDLVEQLLECEQGEGGEEEEGQNQTQPFDASITALLLYLKNVTLLCLHVVQRPSSYAGMALSSAVKRLPFLLLEDAVDSLPLLHVQSLWSSPRHHTLTVSSYATDLLCAPSIFMPSKNVLLRTCNKLLKVLSNQDVDAEFAGSLMTMMAKVFPLSERSAVNVLGSFNVINETMFQDEQEFHRQELACTGSTGGGEGPNIGYEFYKTFWGVQKVFTDPQGTILPSRGGSGQATAATAYNAFMKDITSILVALESTPIQNSSSSSALSDLDEKAAPSADCVVRYHKYLTSSQLLHLQLKDSKLRVHFLSQLLIILSYLTSPSVTLPNLPITSTPGSDSAKFTTQIKSTQTKQLGDMQKRVRDLLRATSPPLGEDVCRSLRWVLEDREVMWKQWKAGKCMPAMDKAGLSAISQVDVKNVLSSRRKRKAGEHLGGVKKEKTAQISKVDLSKRSAPALATFLDPYVEALDPENGIDDEYHPRNDKVYCWRALRLMARDQLDKGHLTRFGKLRRSDGDFEAMVRGIWKDEGNVIGGTLPGNYYGNEREEVQAGDKICEEVSKDVAMDDASVGTPEEEAEAKKEKMAEFAQAAMEVEEEMLSEEKAEEGEATRMTKNAHGVTKVAAITDKEQTDEKEAICGNASATAGATAKKEEATCAIRNAAAETIESLFSEIPMGTVTMTGLKRKAAMERPAAAATIEPKKDSPVSRKEEPKQLSKCGETSMVKMQHPESKRRNSDIVMDKKVSSLAAVGEVQNGNAVKSDNEKVPTPNDIMNESASSRQKSEEEQWGGPPTSPVRAKFTPPPQKTQLQQQRQLMDEPLENPRHVPRAHARGRFGPRRGGSSRFDNDQQQQHQQSSDRKGTCRDNGEDQQQQQQNEPRDNPRGRFGSRKWGPARIDNDQQQQQQQQQSSDRKGLGGGDGNQQQPQQHQLRSRSSDRSRRSDSTDRGGSRGRALPPVRDQRDSGGQPDDNKRDGKGNEGAGGGRNFAPRGGGKGSWEPPHSGGGRGAGGRGGGRGSGSYRGRRGRRS